jgi:hypothetical protein
MSTLPDDGSVNRRSEYLSECLKIHRLIRRKLSAQSFLFCNVRGAGVAETTYAYFEVRVRLRTRWAR